MKRSNLILALSLMTLFFVSCNQEEEIILQEESIDQEVITDEAFIESVADEIFAKSQEFLPDAQGGKYTKNDCPSTELDLRNKTILIDFGSECTGQFGKLIFEGKLIVKFEFNEDLIPIPHTITTEGLMVNGVGIDGTLTINQIDEPEEGMMHYALVYDLTVTFKNGSTFSQSSNFTIKWLEGFGDGIPTNDVLEVSGSSTSTSRFGKSYITNISTPLVKKTSCATSREFITVSGKREVQPASAGSYNVDYGDGSCDRSVTISTPNRTFSIDLP